MKPLIARACWSTSEPAPARLRPNRSGGEALDSFLVPDDSAARPVGNQGVPVLDLHRFLNHRLGPINELEPVADRRHAEQWTLIPGTGGWTSRCRVHGPAPRRVSRESPDTLDISITKSVFSRWHRHLGHPPGSRRSDGGLHLGTQPGISFVVVMPKRLFDPVGPSPSNAHGGGSPRSRSAGLSRTSAWPGRCVSSPHGPPPGLRKIIASSRVSQRSLRQRASASSASFSTGCTQRPLLL